jgi:YVTN family beta-propeller protein
MNDWGLESDDRLVVAAAVDPGAFAEFYARYERAMLAFFVRRTREPELAADLTAEVFAAALAGVARFRPGGAPPAAWLFGIAQHKLAKSRRRGVVEDRARRRLGMPLLVLEDEVGIDDATHTLYMTDSSSDTVSVINAATCNAKVTTGCGQTPATLTVGQGPTGVAVDPTTNTIYITNSGLGGNGVDGSGHTVSVIDGVTCNAGDTAGCGEIPATVAVGRWPFFTTLDAANHTVYVSNALDNNVSMIDAATCNARVRSGCDRTPPRPLPASSRSPSRSTAPAAQCTWATTARRRYR